VSEQRQRFLEDDQLNYYPLPTQLNGWGAFGWDKSRMMKGPGS